MTYVPDCALCRHSYLRSMPESGKKALACAAFPEGVPEEITDTVKTPGGICANGIGYEPGDKQQTNAEAH